MNKTKKALQLLLVLALTVLCFAACGTRTHTVTFHTSGDASITQLVADGCLRRKRRSHRMVHAGKRW